MIGKRLASVMLAADANTSAYIAPAGKTASVAFSLMNTTDGTVLVSASISEDGEPAESEVIMADYLLPPYSLVDMTGVVLGDGQRLVARSSHAGVACNVYGYEV